jgi:2-amino-4-hydroxy-6-hydroxymethyldihydropteridine diphosphokinase
MIDLAADVLVIGLGGNVGGDDAIRDRFVRARTAFGEIGSVTSAQLYRTAPIGPAQASFLNSALRIRFLDGTAGELISLVLEIERLLGRDRRGEPRWGPRTIDLDVLVWGSRVIRTPELEVPHPHLHERRFAMRPLVDVVPADARFPGRHESVAAVEARLHTQQVDEVATTW